MARGRERFDDIFVRSCVSDDLASAELAVKAKLSTPCNVRYTLVAPDGAVVSKGVGGENLSIIISSPVLWNDEEPRLYELWLSVGDEVVLLDLAVRRFEIKDGVCLLNGKAVKARGINRHDSNPVTGHAVTLDDMLGDIMLIKRANCNMIRTSHYPNDPRFLELCDRYGIMLTLSLIHI